MRWAGWHPGTRRWDLPAGAHRPASSLDADATENNPSWEAAAFGLGKTPKASKEKQNYEACECLGGKKEKKKTNPPSYTQQ